MDNDSYRRPSPHYPQAPIGTRIAAATAAVLVSSTLIGGLLGLFDRHAGDAMLAKADMKGATTVATARQAMRPSTAGARVRG